MTWTDEWTVNGRRRSVWRLALRLTRRDLVRAKARTALVVAMIGIPILLSAGLSMVLRSADVAPGDSALRAMGTADAIVTAHGIQMQQDFLGDQNSGNGPVTDPADRTMTAKRVAELTGGDAIPVREGSALVGTGSGPTDVRVREYDLGDERTTGLGILVDGRAPHTPSEVAVSPNLAADGFGPGTRIPIDLDGHIGTAEQKSYAVVGVVRNPSNLDSPQIVAKSGAVLGQPTPDESLTFLVDTGGRAITWPDVQQLNTHGLVVASRAVIEAPPPMSELPPDIEVDRGGLARTALIGVVIACVLLEVVLLAGPAFAVGTRRIRRQLALLVAVGGTPLDVTRVVLAHALILGLLAAVGGIVLATILVALTTPQWSDLLGHDIAPLEFAPLDMGALLVVGTFAALAAAYVPARQAATQDPVTALAGRPGEPGSRRGLPIRGLVLLAAGATAVLSLGRGGAAAEMVVLLGTLTMIAGAIMVTPGVIGLVGRLSGHLPVSLRYATRDSARNRTRTTPAVAAVMAVVAGVTVMGVGSASTYERERRDYAPTTAAGTLTIDLGDNQTFPADAKVIVDKVRAELPGRDPRIVWQLPWYPAGVEPRSVTPLEPGCSKPDPRACPYEGPHRIGGMISGLAAADAPTLAALGGRPLSEEQRRVLDGGGVLVLDWPAVSPDDTVQVATYIQTDPEADTVSDVRRVRLPATALAHGTPRTDRPYVADFVVSPQTAKRLGVSLIAKQLVVLPGVPEVSKEQEARVRELMQGLGYRLPVAVERGYDEPSETVLLVIGLIGGLLVLVGTATATALALDDARPDVATLAALGASPGARRRIAMAQAAVIGILGAGFGVLVGAVPAVGLAWPLTVYNDRTAPVVDVPWSLLGLVVLGVPLLVIVGAGVVTRSRLPLGRRVG
jgi:putative ABC transport system permease protein